MEQRLGLQVLPLPLESPPLPIYMIWHETRRHDPAHRWLREVVAEELSRFAPGLPGHRNALLEAANASFDGHR